MSQTKNKTGRPSKYQTEYAEQAYKLCLLSATDTDLADFFDISESTLNNWKLVHPEFVEALKNGKSVADANVVERLYQRAMGYSHPEDKIFNNNGVALIVPTIKHYPPDTTAAIFWLKNRQPGEWRDRQEIDHTVAINSWNELARAMKGDSSEGEPVDE